MKSLKITICAKFLLITILFIGCKKNSTEVTPETFTPTPTVTVPDIYKKIYGASSVTSDGTFITIKTNGVPDHKSI